MFLSLTRSFLKFSVIINFGATHKFYIPTYVLDIQLYFTLISSGLCMSYVDCVFVTQSRNLRTNIARVLYLTPPVMTLPMAYITTREVLGSMYGEEGVWTYAAAAAVPGCIWGAFSKYNITIHDGSFRLFLADFEYVWLFWA